MNNGFWRLLYYHCSTDGVLCAENPWASLDAAFFTLLCVTMCVFGTVSATPLEGRPHGGYATAAAPPALPSIFAARRLYLYDERAALVENVFPWLSVRRAKPHPDSGRRALRTIVWNAWWMASPQPVGPQHDTPDPAWPEQPPRQYHKCPIGASLMLHGTNKPRSIGTAGEPWLLSRPVHPGLPGNWRTGCKSHSTTPAISDGPVPGVCTQNRPTECLRAAWDHYSCGPRLRPMFEIRAEPAPTSTTISIARHWQ